MHLSHVALHRCLSPVVYSIVVIALICQMSRAAVPAISGRVIDRVSRATVEGANVVVIDGDGHATTDRGGKFSLTEIEPGPCRLAVSHVGYKTAERTVVVGSGTTTSLVVELEPVAEPVGSITVTPGRAAQHEFTLPAGVTVTTSEEFAERDFSSTADALRGETGVLVQKTTHGHGAPIIRGLLGRYVLLLYDGIRLNKPTFRFGANQYMNTVDLETLSGIEVVRGPASVMYGSDAIGGVVNLIPRPPSHDTGSVALAARVTGRYSSADNGRSTHLRLTGSGNRLAGVYELGYKRTGDLRGGGDVGDQSPTGWDETNHAGRFSYRLSPVREVRVDFLSVNQIEVPRYDKYVSGDFEKYVYDPQKRLMAVATLDNSQPGPFFYASRTGIAFQQDKEGRTQQRAGSDDITLADDRVTTFGGYVQFLSLIGSSHWLTYGVEHYRHTIRSEARLITDFGEETVRAAYPDRSKYNSLGVYLQDEWFVLQKVRLTAGLRYSLIDVDSPLEPPFERYERRFSDLTGSLAVSYLATPDINLIGCWSRGFRAPNLNDAVVLKYSSSGVDAPSPGLESEHCDNFELGAKVAVERFRGSLFVYYNRLDDLIERDHGWYNGLSFYDENRDGVRDSTEFDVYQKFNSGRGRIYGLESEAELATCERTTLAGNITWTFGENLSAHEPLSRIPPFMGRLTARFDLATCWRATGFVRFAGAQRRLSERDRDDSRMNPDGTPGWATLNLALRYERPLFSVVVVLGNVLDAKYKEHGSGIFGPGRHVNLGLVYQVSP